MRILLDENIPLAEHYFSAFGEVTSRPGRDITPDDAAKADILIVRSVTRVDEALLRGADIRFVGSCTIGTDHVDLDYLQQRGIGFAHAPGCNADAVVDYVLACIYKLKPEAEPGRCCVGVVGNGNVGSRLASRLRNIGFEVKVNDPPLQAQGQAGLDALRDVMACDVVSLHVPMEKQGGFPTWHLLGEAQLACLPRNALLINAARGGVLDESALLKLLTRRQDLKLALDVWENEPELCIELAQRVDIATPHIAGYSVEGKRRGTYMIYLALAQYLGQQPTLPLLLPAVTPVATDYATVRDLILALYDPGSDTAALRQQLCSPDLPIAKGFDLLRKQYPERFEFARYLIEGVTIPNPILRAHGFASRNEC